MAADKEGTTLAVNDNVWIPATISSISGSNITVTPALGGINAPTFTTGGGNSYKDKPKQFPDRP